MEKNSMIYWIWLSSLVKLSPRKRFELLEYFREPAYLWHAGKNELESTGLLTAGDINVLTDVDFRAAAEVHYENICRLDINMVPLCSPLYPDLLKCIYDPPAVLYVKGTLEPAVKTIAVVGSRRATPYGLDTSARLAYGMAGYGITVASGMARGIDTYAHKGALKAGGKTVAVLGCGLDTVYPPENRKLMQQISENGAVLSEFLPGTPPVPYNFPARNRIISGISLGVVIVEAGDKSGSLITTDFALEQGRDVFSVPGNINSPNSTGTNRLIREGARIVTGLVDILDELGVNHDAGPEKKRHETECLDNEEKQVVKCLKKGSMDMDEISRKCGLEINRTSSILLMLELKAVVEQLPGKQFRLLEA